MIHAPSPLIAMGVVASTAATDAAEPSQQAGAACGICFPPSP
jgi:hypothetical protein